MGFDGLIQGTLLRRYKRFLADIELPGGEQITAHCPNTGAMTGCADPGSPVWLSISDSKTRKYPHTWELVDTSTGMACIHSARANKVVHEAFANAVVPGFEDYPEIATEVKYGKNSRIDLLLSGERGRVYIEVKSVTLCREGGWGVFPDAVSERGRKHLLELAEIAKEPNTRALMFYCALHNGVKQVAAARDIDPLYSETLAQVMEQGVEVLAWRAAIGPEGIELNQALPFALDVPG